MLKLVTGQSRLLSQLRGSIWRCHFSNERKAKLLTSHLVQNNKYQIQPFYPKQHPKQIDSPDSRLYHYDKPIHYKMPQGEVPYEVHLSHEGTMEFEYPENSMGLEVAVVGPPNSGKSSLINAIIGKEFCPVSNKAGTTWEQHSYYYTNQNNKTQIILYDTPGISKNTPSSKFFLTKGWDVISDCNSVLFVVDALKMVDGYIREGLKRLNSMHYSEKEAQLGYELSELKGSNSLLDLKNLVDKYQGDKFDERTIPKLLIMNKMDLCTNKKRLRYIQSEIEDFAKFEKVFYVSSHTSYGIEELKAYLESKALKRNWTMHPESKTELSKADLIEGALKQALFNRFYYKIPFMTGIRLKEYTERSDGLAKVHLDLDVANKNEARLIAGKNARNLTIMKNQVRAHLIKLFKKNFIVHLRVLIRHNSLHQDIQTPEFIVHPDKPKSEAQGKVQGYKEERQEALQKLGNYIDREFLDQAR